MPLKALLSMNLAPVKRWKSARRLAHSTTLSRGRGVADGALASWTAPVLWRFSLRFSGSKREIVFRKVLSLSRGVRAARNIFIFDGE